MQFSQSKVLPRCLSVLTAACLLCTTAGATELDDFDDLVYIVNQYSLFTAEEALSDDFLAPYVQAVEEGDLLAIEAIAEVLEEIDPYGYYITAEVYAELFSDITGFVGVGIVMRTHEQGAEITSILRGSPAVDAQLQAGDLLIAVDDTTVAGCTLTEIGALLAGEQGESVAITYLRDDVSETVYIARDTIYQNTLVMDTLSDSVQYYALSGFSNPYDIDALIEDWLTVASEAEYAPAVILDLRGNAGGVVSYALELVNAFASDEDTLLFVQRLRERDYEVYADGTGIAPREIIILVDEDTASAAELTAAALVDIADATLVGSDTYGKGYGQRHLTLSNDDVMMLTVLELQAPASGGWDGEGLAVDIEADGLQYINTLLTPFDTTTPLYAGDTGESVATLAVWLDTFGYGFAKGEEFDLSVLLSLTAFQLQTGQRVSGYADVNTLAFMQLLYDTYETNQTVIDEAFSIAWQLCKP